MKPAKPMLSSESLALSLGGKLVRNDGSVFNASGRVANMRVPKPEQPQPTASNGHEKLTAALAEMMSKLHVQQAAPQPAPVVNVPPAQVVVNQQPRCSWDFVFTRNSDGSIKSIRAIPVKE